MFLPASHSPEKTDSPGRFYFPFGVGEEGNFVNFPRPSFFSPLCSSRSGEGKKERAWRLLLAFLLGGGGPPSAFFPTFPGESFYFSTSPICDNAAIFSLLEAPPLMQCEAKVFFALLEVIF